MFWRYCLVALGLLWAILMIEKCTPVTKKPKQTIEPTAIEGIPIPLTLSKGLAELNAADRASAIRQKVCPVSGEPLGSMGTPILVKVNDDSVWICCDGCEERLKKDPAKYLKQSP